MKINKVVIKNFYSIREATVNFDDYGGIVIISGENKDTGGSNGAGKSTIFEAVVWGLFGKTIRKSTEDALINATAKKHCEVQITINGDHVITRKKRPTFLDFQAGDETFTRESITETQMVIESTLNTNYPIFMASMVFGQHSELDFVSATPDEKRKIIKNFLNMGDLFDRRDKIKKLKSLYGAEIRECDAALAEVNTIQANALKTLEDIEGQRGSILGQHNLTKEDLNKYTLEEILELEEAKNKLESQIRAQMAEYKAYEDNLATIKEKLDAGLQQEEYICSECGNEKAIKVVTQEDLDDLKRALTQLEQDMKLCSVEGGKLVIASECIVIPIASNEYKKIEDWKLLKAKKHTFEDSVDQCADRILELEGKRKEAALNADVMKFWEVAFSEQGIIKFVIRNILEYFNERSNYYLGPLTNGRYYIEFDDSLNERIFIGGKETMHMSLSGGERRKLNMAVLLALHDLLSLTNKDQSDILFFDEIAENIDDTGMDGLYILLRELREKKTIFLITHHKYLKSLLDDSQEIKVVKKNGETKIK